jgi:hypothetical protein
MALRRGSNTLGNQYALTVLTPIVPGAEPGLRAYLESFDDTGSPFARLPRTHFARWVILDGFVRESSQRHADELGASYLVFSATFDGDVESYLDELCDRLGDEAERIWGACAGAPTPACGVRLKRYLRHNQIDTGLFFAAYPEATVADVRAALDQRNRVIDLALRAQSMSAGELQRRFLEEF